MARWVCSNRPHRILDPALGEGVFVEAVEKSLVRTNGFAPSCIDVFEVDSRMLKAFEEKAHFVRTRCRNQDFITTSIRATYDAVIANPPYVRHHAMDYGDEVIRRFDALAGERLSRMTNLYGLFLIKIWTLLAPGGRAAVITPAEWLNADFGRAIKAFFLRENAIEAVLHFDHAAQVFDNALTTAAITLFRRGRGDDDDVKLLTVHDLRALQAVDLNEARRFRRSELEPAHKWTPLFSTRGRRTSEGSTLGDVARCTRGIATGANRYFTLRESERRHHGIDLRDMAFCITKAQQIREQILTKAHVRQLVQMDERIHLLQPRPRITAAVKRYLEEGRRLGVHKRYLPSHRPVWYRPEQRKAAPILVSVFAREAFRFVVNRAGILSLTAYHAIYLHAPGRDRVNALFDYLISHEAQNELRHHQRIYADGLLKLEPRDVEALSIPMELSRRLSG
ncbi:MAG: BREX-1 system adenine-specific DNA-methyltransferase PglX [Phycisphaerales bacterium]|nr:BREX-1 system adenine-specific DNA-methyltransferase PglX [Phycisphaerales bacterium]